MGSTRHEAFNEREKDIQSLEDEIKQTSHQITTLSLSKHGFDADTRSIELRDRLDDRV